jgi:hypothetical protein
MVSGLTEQERNSTEENVISFPEFMASQVSSKKGEVDIAESN